MDFSQKVVFFYMDEPISIKVVLLGDSGVGKTSIVTKYVTGCMPDVAIPTVGAAFVTKDVNIDNHSYQLLIWDTAGQELYRGLSPMYYRSASIAIIVYDVTNLTSFKSVEYWVNELRENAEQDIIIMICGNKIDIEKRQVECDYAQSQANGYHTLYAETSASNGSGVERLFQLVINEVIKKESASQDITSKKVQVGDTMNAREKSDCC